MLMYPNVTTLQMKPNKVHINTNYENMKIHAMYIVKD